MGKNDPRIIIIGAGACGIGAAWCLYKKRYNNWIIFEKNNYPGGLSASFKDKKEFIWDIGGHVLCSNYKYFNEFLQEVLGSKYVTHKRNSWIRIFDSWVPYPFQNNIHHLPRDKFQECLEGLEGLVNPSPSASNFKDWIVNNYGMAIAEYFMVPLNKKIWSYPLESMSSKWVDNKISPVDLGSIKKAINKQNSKIINGEWGGNNKFMYPLHGGIGEVFNRAIDLLGHYARLNYEVYKIDLNSKTIFFKNGRKDRFDILINTANLKKFTDILQPKNVGIVNISKRLRCNKLLIIGIGLKKKRKDSRSWIYFPENRYPFFRLTNLSNYSTHNVPQSNSCEYSSLLLEFSFAEDVFINKNLVIEETIKSLIDADLILESDIGLIESTFSFEVDNAYPVPTLDRDEILNKIKYFLEPKGIFSLGRFGSFRYETGKMDECFMQGFETVKQVIDKP